MRASALRVKETRCSGWGDQLPDGWNVERLKRVADVRPSNVDKKSVDGEQPVRLCNYTDVYYGDQIHESLELMEATAPSRAIERFSLRRGDLIVTKDSETRTDIAVPAFVAQDLPEVLCGYHLALIRPRPSAMDGRFLHYGFLADGIRDQFHVFASGITRFGLTTRALGDARFPVPPVSAQRRIADFLDRETAHIDRLIEKKERLIALLEEKRSALITRAVTKGLDPDVPMKDSGVEWIGEIPEHWRAVKLRRVAELRTGHTPSRDVAEYWTDCTIPWVTLADVWGFRTDQVEVISETKEKISRLGLDNSSAVRLPAGTVLLSRTASVGFSVIAGVDLATTQDFVNWIPGVHVTSRYLLYVLRAMRPEFRRLTMGSTHQTIYMPDVEGLAAPLPPLEEQEAIVQALGTAVAQIRGAVEQGQRSIALLRERRSALITAAVTGQIDVDEYERSYRAPLAPDHPDLDAPALTASAATPDA